MKSVNRIHRVGAITTGISCVVYGVLFLVHLFFKAIPYQLMFKLWPLILIGVGIEIIVANEKDEVFVYDKAAILLMFVITVFAMFMAGMEANIIHI